MIKTQTEHLAASDTKEPSWLVAIPFFVAGVVFSLWYLDAYYSGDAVQYTKFYNALYGMPAKHWQELQRIYLGSGEPLYAYLVAAGAYFGMDRIYYLSLWNGLLIGSIGYILIKFRASITFSALVMTNFYLFVLLASAERLKFSYIFLILAFATTRRSVRFLLAAASPFIHTQAMVQFVSGFAYYIVEHRRNFYKTPLKGMLIVVGSIIAIGVVSYVFYSSVGQSIEEKSAHYSAESSGLGEAIQWVMLLVTGTFLFKERLAYFVGMLPMGVLTIMFGNRVNVATLAMFAGIAILQRRTFNPWVLLVMGYMSIKSIPFMLDVLKYGTGFL